MPKLVRMRGSLSLDGLKLSSIKDAKDRGSLELRSEVMTKDSLAVYLT